MKVYEHFSPTAFEQSINWDLVARYEAAKDLKRTHPEAWEQLKKQLNNTKK